MSQRRPNILICITHDTGRHLGCYGADVETPSINRLAEQGVLFTQAYCTAPQCSPSRGSLLTGMVPHRHGLIGLAHRGFRLRPGVALLPRILAEAGYSTHLFGIQHETHHLRAAELGYQVQHAVKDTSCESLAHAVKDFLSSAPSQPFFASVGSFETHRPYPKAAPPPKSLRVPPYLPDVPEVRQDIADLQTAVRRVDHALRQIVSALQEHRLWENTLLIYTTDHGIAFPGAKATLFDPGVGIALLMHGAGFEGGKKIEAMVSNMDILPTLCEVTGVMSPLGIDGKSLVPLVQGKVSQTHRHLFVEQTYHAAYDPLRGVRTERYKYIRSFARRPFWLPPNVDNGHTKDWYRQHKPEVFRDLRPSEMLFDLQADPLERNNLAGNPEYEPVLARLRQMVDKWMRETDDPLMKGHVPPPEGAQVTPSRVWSPEEGVTDRYDPAADEW